MDIPNGIGIAILGGCNSTTNFLHTFDHERMSRLGADTVTPSTQSYHVKACTLDEGKDKDDPDSQFVVVAREFESDRLKDPHLLYCFQTRTEPPDGFIIVYDPTLSFSLEEAEELLAAVVGASWEPRLVELNIIWRRVERDIRSSSPSLASLARELWGKKRYNKFRYFPRLPYDLKLAVLRACLVSPDPIVDRKPQFNGINTNLLLVNRFCYEVGGNIYRNENRFVPLPAICLVADSSTRHFWPAARDSGEILVSKGRQLAERVGVGFCEIPCKSRSDVHGVVVGVVREYVAREERVLKHRLQQRNRGKRSLTGRGRY